MSTRLSFRFSLLLLLSAALAPSLVAQASADAPREPAGNRLPEAGALAKPPAVWREGFESIQAEDCRKWLEVLAGDAMEGRGTGQPGFEKAARWIADRFKEFGLEPVAENGSYFQMVPFEGTQVVADKSWIALLDPKGKDVLHIPVGKGLGGRILEASSKKTPELVLVVAEDAEDIDTMMVRSKTVLLLDRSGKDRYRRSIAQMALRRARVSATLLIDDRLATQSAAISVRDAGRKRNLSGRWRRPNRYALTMKVAVQILEKARVAWDLQNKNQTGTLRIRDYRLQTKIEVETKPVFACNVVGMIRGSDPELSKEIVGIGSHLDHLGKRGSTIYNGADDDGSGTTGLLAVARAFAKNKQKPKRSLLFMAFCGEEKGLIGSKYYVEHPIFDNSRMVAELQMDMIGRNEESSRSKEKAEDNINSLHLVGSKKLSYDLHQICMDANDKYARFAFEYDQESVFSRSDHVSFARKDIPIAFFFTGFHPQYHQPSDTVDRINFPKLARVARLVYSIAWTTADGKNRPIVDHTFVEAMKNSRKKR